MPTYPKLFFHLSVIVCGEANLDRDLSNEYWDIFNNDATISPDLRKMLELYDSILQSNPSDILIEIKKQMMTDEPMRELLRKIIKIWYLGRPPVKELKGPRFFYHYEALIWKVAHAHPPGLSGGYYGYWHYKPEN